MKQLIQMRAPCVLTAGSSTGLGFGRLQKLLRSGQIRVDGGRVKSDTRLQPGQNIRIPPNIDEVKHVKPLTANTIR